MILIPILFYFRLDLHGLGESLFGEGKVQKANPRFAS